MTTTTKFQGWSDSTLIAEYGRTRDMRCIDELERRAKARRMPLHVVSEVVVNQILDAMEMGAQN